MKALNPRERIRRRFDEDGQAGDTAIEDQRSVGEQDRDRILYSTAFRRLAGVSQVVPAVEGHRFHNRLTHALEVAQIGRRLGQRLVKETDKDLVALLGGLDPEVVEAACLAHDIGNPPFGHVGERELDSLIVSKLKAMDGFEGNAQTFRILTKLALRRPGVPGLNLSRATLNAVLKYPWTRESDGKKNRKWGAYHSEKADFAFARSKLPLGRRTIEAEIMDYSDDVAYSVHDMQDLYRAGVIPLELLSRDTEEREQFFAGVRRRWRAMGNINDAELEASEAAFVELSSLFRIGRFTGTSESRSTIRMISSALIGRYVKGPMLQEGSTRKPAFLVDENYLREISMLKELTWHYVIDAPLLAVQQEGQRRVIRELFEIFQVASEPSRDRRLFPAWCQEQLHIADGDSVQGDSLRVRTVADLIASFTEQEAVATYSKILGISPASIFSP